MMWKCWDYREDGSICGQPANHIDYEKGFTVCTQHQNSTQTNSLFTEPLFPDLPFSPKELTCCEIKVQAACYLNRKWHSILPTITPANIWRSRFYIAFGLLFKAEFIGVAIYSAPVNQYMDDGHTLELR